MQNKPNLYPNYSRLRSNPSYIELIRLFPMREIHNELDALEDYKANIHFKIPTLPPRTSNPFTYAILSEQEKGQDAFIQNHIAVLYDLGLISNNFVTNIDSLDLITESRRGSVVAFLDMFEKAEDGILVVDLDSSKFDESIHDAYSSFFRLLLNHAFNFALYIKASSSEWEKVESIFPSIRFIVRQVFTI